MLNKLVLESGQCLKECLAVAKAIGAKLINPVGLIEEDYRKVIANQKLENCPIKYDCVIALKTAKDELKALDLAKSLKIKCIIVPTTGKDKKPLTIEQKIAGLKK